MKFIGIDPGVQGGIASIDEDGSYIRAVKMPEDKRELLQVLKSLGTFGPDNTRAALEFVRSSPQMGVVGAFTFGRGFGAIEMALIAANVPYYEVVPQRWQKLLDCRTGGDKNISKARAAQLWPGVKVTHAIADALLIAEWCRRKTIGKGNQE